MIQKNIRGKITFLFFLLTNFFSLLAFGQADLSLAPKILSPNATSFEKFGEIPVSLFTGTPDITIPIHSVSYGKINIPLNLRYHPALVKPSIQPGWTGMGWDLDGMGRITRQVRYQADEDNVDLSNPVAEYLGTGGQYFEGMGTISGCSLANDYTSWSDVENLNYDFERPTTFSPAPPNTGFRRGPKTDVMADEFNFNFLGHSGKFYYAGTTKGWQVVSDESIKVIFDNNDFIEGAEMQAELAKHSGVVLSPGFPDLKYSGRMFKQFTLITPDGTKFIFGGNDGIEFSLSEYYAPVRSSTDTHFFNYTMTADSWVLKTIIDANENKIDFNYDHGKLIFNLPFDFGGGYSFSDNGQPIGSPPIWPYTPSTSTVDINHYLEELQAPLYVSSITTPNEKISFIRSSPICLKFNNNQVLNNMGYPRPLYGLLGNNLPSNLSNTGPQQLDKITVAQTNSNSILNEFDFTYSSNPLQRLTLNSINQKDINNHTNNHFSFEYNSNSNDLFQTDYCGNFSDHWGFYNTTNVDGAASGDIFSRKQPNATAILSGLLKKIIYPTGGASQFTWEIDDYGKVVSFDRQSLSAYQGIGGGIRINKIQNYTSDNVLATEKKYYYRTGFNNTVADINLLPSSGILNCIPKYTGQFVNREGFSGSYVYFNSFIQYSYNAQGSPVGYPEVVEVNKDGSYTKFFYTSYGTDLNNVSHWDHAPINTIGWVTGVDPYIPMSSLENERGKLIGEFVYNSNDILLKKTVTTYRQDAARFNNFINWIEYGGAYRFDDFSGNRYPNIISFAASCKKYQYSYYPVSKTTTLFDQDGNNPIVDISQYSYNLDNQVISELKTNSKSNSVITTFKYPKDFQVPGGIYTEMVSKNILSPLIVKATTINNLPTNSLTTNYFSPFTGKYLPQSVDVKIGSNNAETRMLYNKYDIYGNIIEQQKINDIKESYQWGFKGQYPIAKVSNAANNYSAVIAPEPPNTQYSSMDTYNPTKIITFTSPTTFNVTATNTPVTSYGYRISVILVGPKYYSVELCSSYGGTECPLMSNATFTNIIPGTYTIYFNGDNGPAGNGINYNYFNTGTLTTEIYNGEFFYDGFEENVNPLVVEGGAHTGTKYWNGNYTCNFVVPNSKNYLVQWWSYHNNKWQFHQQPYTYQMVLTGPVDDIRIFPSNALMSTYTYKPLIGLNTETDPNGRTVYYEYDNFNRLSLVRDNDNNIIKKICYNYAGQVEDCVTGSSSTAQWRPTGNSRCQACPQNSNYISDVKEKEERDINPSSPTYNTLHWVVDPLEHCVPPPAWQQRPDLAYCEQNSNGINTGNLVTPVYDINPCSSSYGQPGISIVSLSPGCSPASCSTLNCLEPEYKCVNGICTHGTWSIVRVSRSGLRDPVWTCIYAWCFPDGTTSTYTQTTTGSTACTVNCY